MGMRHLLEGAHGRPLLRQNLSLKTRSETDAQHCGRSRFSAVRSTRIRNSPGCFAILRGPLAQAGRYFTLKS